jgi:threonine aldolase
VPGIEVDPAKVMTNIVIFDVSATGIPPAEISARLKQRGVLLNAINDRCLRAVTHFDVDRAQCSLALDAVAESVAASVAGVKPS